MVGEDGRVGPLSYRIIINVVNIDHGYHIRSSGGGGGAVFKIQDIINMHTRVLTDKTR